MGEVKDTILSQSWGQTGQGAGKGGMLGAFPPGHLGGHGAVQEDKGPRKDPHPGRTVRRSRYQLAQAGSHSSPQIPGGGWFPDACTPSHLGQSLSLRRCC